jgi:hypothetical protein
VKIVNCGAAVAKALALREWIVLGDGVAEIRGGQGQSNRIKPNQSCPEWKVGIALLTFSPWEKGQPGVRQMWREQLLRRRVRLGQAIGLENGAALILAFSPREKEEQGVRRVWRERLRRRPVGRKQRMKEKGKRKKC